METIIHHYKKIKLTLLSKNSLLLVFAVFILMSYASMSSAQIVLPNPLSNTSSFSQLLANITTYIAGLVGSIAVLMFVWAGILFLTSAGNESRLSSAKKMAWYAVIGLAIALSGTGLVELVQAIIG